MVEGLDGCSGISLEDIIRLTVGREGERGEVEHDKIIEGGSNFLLGIE